MNPTRRAAIAALPNYKDAARVTAMCLQPPLLGAIGRLEARRTRGGRDVKTQVNRAGELVDFCPPARPLSADGTELDFGLIDRDGFDRLRGAGFGQGGADYPGRVSILNCGFAPGAPAHPRNRSNCRFNCNPFNDPKHPNPNRQGHHAALAELGQSSETVIAKAQTSPIKDKLKQQTERAKSLGVFGAPSFTVNHELFWGDDRLEEAIKWA